MLKIRRFEQLLDVLHTKGEIRGTLHLAEGQEAIAVGLASTMDNNDIVTAGHRADHILLARGVPMHKLLAEILGTEDGFSNGYGGAMHVFAKDYGIWGTSGIVAAALPIAAGIALSKQKEHSEGMVYSFIGDGATTEGSFHETMNMISLWNIPMIIICENNLYAQTTSLGTHSANIHIANKVSDMYKIKSNNIDGNDIMRVIEAATEAREYVQKTGKPFFIECTTFRISGHSVNDKNQTYKKEGELMAWEKKDPIRRFITELMRTKAITEETEKDVERDVLHEINESIKAIGIK